MKFVEQSRFNDPDTAARKLVEIANAAEAVEDGRLYIERVAERRVSTAPRWIARSPWAGCGGTNPQPM
jgi:hypothetical protein